MLVLGRFAKEGITIGDNIKVTIVRIEGNRVVLGVEAPPDVKVLRNELARREAPPRNLPGAG